MKESIPRDPKHVVSAEMKVRATRVPPQPKPEQKLAAAGFDAIDIEPTRVYSIDDAREFLGAAGIDVDTIAPQVKDKFISAFVRAQKPAAASCCGPTCCAN